MLPEIEKIRNEIGTPGFLGKIVEWYEIHSSWPMYILLFPFFLILFILALPITHHFGDNPIKWLLGYKHENKSGYRRHKVCITEIEGDKPNSL